VSGTFDLAAFRAGYLAEVDEHLGAAYRDVRTAEASVARGEASPKAVRELFRALHTIKGLSAMVGVEPIVDIAHAMETVLRTADREGGLLERAAFDAVANGLAEIDQRVRALAAGREVPPAPADLLEALAAVDVARRDRRPSDADPAVLAPELWERLPASEREQLRQGARAGRRAVSVAFTASASRSEAGAGIVGVQERVRAIAEIVKVVPRSRGPDGALEFVLALLTDAPDEAIAEAAGVGADAVGPILAPRPAPADRAAAVDAPPADATAALGVGSPGVVRVDLARLDHALDKLAAVVVTRFRLERAAADLGARGADVRALAEIVAENGRQVRALRAAIVRARLVSAAELLERVPLLVRGLARTTQKAVDVEVDAGDAELDKAVAERIFPAVVHLVRNAVDHAIEPPADRLARGKPAAGRVRVECFETTSGRLELRVEDDGRGIDRAAIARERPDLSDQELLGLLCRAGFSTREAADATSGRGMGLDIVKRAVDDLGGELALSTDVGRGTTFVLRVPLSITIVDAFSLGCGEERFVVPVAMVDEIIEVDDARLVRGPRAAGARAGGRRALGVIEHRGEVVPVVALEAALGLPEAHRASRKAVLVRRGARPVAFAVDRLFGRQEVVVRPLRDPLVKVVGISGSADLGDGTPALVLDLVALGQRVAHPEEAAA
jgi:two-component system chemotaxis sensor kinase CheA